MGLKIIALLLNLSLLSGCGTYAAYQSTGTAGAETAIAARWTLTSTATITTSATPTLTQTRTATITSTPTMTATATITHTPTVTHTPSTTPTPTFAFPEVEVHTQAHCRYGPSTAYLHAADLYPGDVGSVRGRFAYSAWLYVKFDKLTYFCWVSPSVVDVRGDISILWFTEPKLQQIGSNQYGPPQNVRASRNNDQVTITWDRMEMTEDKDRGYFLEAWVCLDGIYRWWTVSFPNQFVTSYTVKDEPGCITPSRGELLTVQKHGYSEPATIAWP